MKIQHNKRMWLNSINTKHKMQTHKTLKNTHNRKHKAQKAKHKAKHGHIALINSAFHATFLSSSLTCLPFVDLNIFFLPLSCCNIGKKKCAISSILTKT